MLRNYLYIFSLLFVVSCGSDDDGGSDPAPDDSGGTGGDGTGGGNATITLKVDGASVTTDDDFITKVGQALSISGINNTTDQHVVLTINADRDAGTFNVPTTGTTTFADNVTYTDSEGDAYPGNGTVTIDSHDKVDNTIKGSYDFTAQNSAQDDDVYQVTGTFEGSYQEF